MHTCAPAGSSAATLGPVLGEGSRLPESCPPRRVELLLEVFTAALPPIPVTLPPIPVALDPRQLLAQSCDLSLLFLNAGIAGILLRPGTLPWHPTVMPDPLEKYKSTIDGVDAVADPIGVQRLIGVLPDAHGLYVRLTAREHLRYVAELHALDAATIGRSIDRLVQLLDMREIIDRRVAGFSTGERMKVAVGRALVHDPPNLLLDEPTNGLDVMSTRAMRDLIRRLKDEGKCVLFSSHIMQEVSMLCDEIVIVARGRAIAYGTPAELCQRAGEDDLEEAFVRIIGTDEGLQ